MTAIYWGTLTLILIGMWVFLGVRALEPNLQFGSSTRTWLEQRDPVRFVAYCALALGLLVAIGGHRYSGPLLDYVRDFYANGATELVSIAITILIIDRLYERKQREHEKQRLILQLGSSHLGFATEASRLLNLHGWLTDGSVRKAYLHGTNLSRALLVAADFQGCELSQAKFRFAALNKANLKKAYLLAADLSDTHLIEANLEEATLAHANLSRATMSGANLVRANLQGANMQATNLLCANLADADLTDADLLEAIYDQNTEWPSGFEPEMAGAILIAQ